MVWICANCGFLTSFVYKFGSNGHRLEFFMSTVIEIGLHIADIVHYCSLPVFINFVMIVLDVDKVARGE